MTKLHKTDAEIRRERADAEIRSRFLALRSAYPEITGTHRFIMTICDERRNSANIKSPRGVLLSLRRTNTI